MRFLFDVHIETEIAIPNIAGAGSPMRDYIFWCIQLASRLCSIAGLAAAWRDESVLPDWVLEEPDSSVGARLLMLSKNHTVRGGIQHFLTRPPPVAAADTVSGAAASIGRKRGTDQDDLDSEEEGGWGGVQSAHDEWPRSCFVLLYHALLPTFID